MRNMSNAEIFAFQDPTNADWEWTAVAMNFGIRAFGQTDEEAVTALERLINMKLLFCAKMDIMGSVELSCGSQYIQDLYDAVKGKNPGTVNVTVPRKGNDHLEEEVQTVASEFLLKKDNGSMQLAA